MPTTNKTKEKENIKNKLFIFQAWANKIPANKRISEQLKYLFSLSQNIVASYPLIVITSKSNEAVCYFVDKKKLWRLPVKLPRLLLKQPLALPQPYQPLLTNGLYCPLPGSAADEIWHQLIKHGQKLKIDGQPLIKIMTQFNSLLRIYRPEIPPEKIPLLLVRFTYRLLKEYEITVLKFLAQIIVNSFKSQNGWYTISALGEIIYPIVCLNVDSQEKELYFAHSLPFDADWFWIQKITIKNFLLNLARYHFN